MPRKEPYRETGPLAALVPDTMQRTRVRRKALDDAFAEASQTEQDTLKRNAERLIQGPPGTPKPIRGLGLDSALEILAALGSFMNRQDHGKG